jgi:hypothetical protein
VNLGVPVDAKLSVTLPGHSPGNTSVHIFPEGHPTVGSAQSLQFEFFDRLNATVAANQITDRFLVSASVFMHVSFLLDTPMSRQDGALCRLHGASVVTSAAVFTSDSTLQCILPPHSSRGFNALEIGFNNNIEQNVDAPILVELLDDIQLEALSPMSGSPTTIITIWGSNFVPQSQLGSGVSRCRRLFLLLQMWPRLTNSLVLPQ